MDLRTFLKLFVLLAGALPSMTRADSAIAESATGTPYACANERSVEDAKRCVLDVCRNQSGQTCALLDTSPRDSGGYAAVVQSATRVTWAIGFMSQDDANRVAMKRCAEQAAPGETCAVSLTYLDRHRFNPMAGNMAPVYVQVR